MRRILSILLLSFVFAGCESYHALDKWYAERGVVEKIGVLANLEITWPKSAAPLARALSYFREEGVTKVVILGEPTKNGYEDQRRIFENTWREVFRGGTAPARILADDPYLYEGISFTGEGKYPLTDLLCIEPCDGHLVNAGSMHGIAVSEVFLSYDARTKATWQQSAQGLLVLKSSGERGVCLTIRRLDFSNREVREVGPAWTVDHEGVIHGEENLEPQFWKDTRLSVVGGYDGKGQRLYTVRWPNILARHTGVRAFSYDVSVGSRVLRRVQSPNFHTSEDADQVAVSCMIYETELNGEEPIFSVTPISSRGKRGAAITAGAR